MGIVIRVAAALILLDPQIAIYLLPQNEANPSGSPHFWYFILYKLQLPFGTH